MKSIMCDGYRGREGDIININAEDDFMVTHVQVFIYDTNNLLIEKGRAILRNENIWIYAVTGNMKGSRIEAVAHDRPGNEGNMTLAV